MPARTIASIFLATAFPAAIAIADGSPSGYPICTMPGDQLAPFSLPTPVSHGLSGGRGALLFWQDQREAPADGGDLWMALLDETLLSAGDILPADGSAAVQRPGEQSQPVAARVGSYQCPLQWGCLSTVLAYTESDGVSPNRVIRATRLFDQFMSWDVQVSLSTHDVFDPHVVDDASPGAGGGTGAIVSWLEAIPHGETRLRAQRLAVDGSKLWGEAGLAVVTDTSGQLEASMLKAPGGGAYFSWRDSRLPDSTAIYAMRLTAEGSPAPGWPAEGRLLRRGVQPQSPRIAGDDAGGLFLMWDELEPLADLSHGLQPRMVHLLADGSLAPGWPASGLRLVVRDDVPLYVDDLLEDGTGGACVSMRSFDGVTSRVIVQRVLPDGTRPEGWNESGREACTTPGSEYESRLSAEAGVVTVVWMDTRLSNTESDVYAARFLADGTRPSGWPATGLLVGQAAGMQHQPVVAPGMGEGVIVAWLDERDASTSGSDLWGQTVNFAGRLNVEAVATPPALALAFASAQPSRGPARFRLALPVAGLVTAEVFDLFGRRLAWLEDGLLAPGVHVLEWKGRDDGGAAGPGVRFLRVRTPAGEKSLRFVSVR